MKRLLTLLTGFFILISILPLRAQDLIKNSTVTGVCYAGKKISRVSIPPPEVFFRKGRSKSGGSITVNYTGFASQAKVAMDYAISILKSILPADTKFTIDASWVKISAAGVLAQSSITNFIPGKGIDALNPLSYYPIALAEKISGTSFNADTEGDITLQVNSSIQWYLGTDRKAPTTNYDLVTVVLHEICHGLGFYDSFSNDGTNGSYGIGSIPMIYDTFVENADGNRLTDTLKFLNNSATLGSQLVSNKVYFNGPLLKNYTTSDPIHYTVFRAKLYAPGTWDAGSSISHLDEASGILDRDALMTPFINLGEAIHDPGKFTLSILGDVGWINTRIIHVPGGDTESHLTELLLSATIKSDTAYDHSRVGVVFSLNNFLTSDSLYLTSLSNNNTFNTTISIPGYNTQLQYYFLLKIIFTGYTDSRLYIKILRLLRITGSMFILEQIL